ncbi:hypothetical protein F5Y19DRAFT_476312 [Xylariaceae sp. FL1651]|nr:hypothetical protein F5Y19DRAFT_476312 [Xylariaceae sp. FL1651]
MTRESEQTRSLKEAAEKLINGKDNIRLDSDETTGANDFKYQIHPNVVGVVIDKGSQRGFIQISGDMPGSAKKIHTSPGMQGERYIFEEISEGQSCMLYGEPTVWYVLQKDG